MQPSDHPSPDGATPSLLTSLVQDAFLFIAAIRADLTVEFASQPITRLLGHDPVEMRGRSVADYLHPDDVERALLQVSGWERHGAPSGTTSFRLRHADGRWLGFDVTAATVGDGDDSYIAVYCTPVDYQHATDRVLARLLGGGTRADAIEPVLDVFAWELNDARIAIAWTEPDGERRFASTGLPAELSGVAGHDDDPWAHARTTGEPLLAVDQDQLDPALRRLAAEHGRGGLWVVPVGDDEPERAVITVWSPLDGPRPDGHAYGMSVAITYVELILRWSRQTEQLERAARRDPLTGLANRRALFDALESGDAHGALLFCDLDHFKPINDALGHAAGDEALRQIARRLEQAVRATDLVARTGGDEFVVLAPDIGLEQAAALAQRIRSAVAEPTEVDGHLVQVGVTIGVAYATDVLSEATLGGADQALTRAKARDRGTVRWAPGPMPQAQLPLSLPD
jgi:diguanylate cyclase (GGDEF)-like protein/PAS domain S-box-containing protein